MTFLFTLPTSSTNRTKTLALGTYTHLRNTFTVVIRETIGVEIVIVVHDVERKSFGCYYIIMFVSTFQRWLFVLVHFSGLTKKRKEKEKKEFGSFKK